MASLGPLLLLMMSAFFLISTVTTSTSDDQNQQGKTSREKLKKVREGLKAWLKSGLKNRDDIKAFGTTSLSLMKDVGSLIKGLSESGTDIFKLAASVVNVVPVIGSVFSLIMTIVSVILKHVNDQSLLKDIKEEFDKIDLKLDKHYKELKWDIWAATTYSKPEMKIRKAWTEYKTLLGSLAGAKDDAERKRHEAHFMEAYLKYKDATQTLDELLKKTKTTFIKNLRDELAEHVKCHEKEILEYTVLILTLIFKGNMMNDYYYKLKNIESKTRTDELNNIVYNAQSAMFEIHKQCIIDSMIYVEQDVKPLIDKTEKRDDQAKKVWSFLKDTYDRYDWMVVAFITKKSSHKWRKTLNKHVLSGFKDVNTQRITVAVSRQVKGTHTKVQEVSKAIEKCIPEKVLCYKVAETLSKCEEKVAGIPVSQTYTAVHAYIRKAHQSIDAKEANPKAKAKNKAKAKDEEEDEDEVNAAPETHSAETPYIYTGKCEKSPGVTGGKFVVLIKSDEEMMVKDPCSKLDCGKSKRRGSCVPMKDMFLAMCDCNHPYYGQHCEDNINDYGIELEREAGTQNNKKPLNRVQIVKEKGTQVKVTDMRRRNSRKQTS